MRCARPPSPSRRGRGQCTQAPIGIGSAKCVRDIAEILARSLQGQIRRLIAEQRVEGPSNVGRRRYVIVRDRKMVIHLEFRVLGRLGRQALGVDGVQSIASRTLARTSSLYVRMFRSRTA